METRDSAFDGDTDETDGDQSQHLQSLNNGSKKRRPRHTKAQRQARKELTSEQVVSLSTTSVPVASNLPQNDTVLPIIPVIFANLQEVSYHRLLVGYYAGVAGLHYTEGCFTFCAPDKQWYAYEINADMSYIVLDPMVPNAVLLGSQAMALAKYAINPFSTTSLQFWTTEFGKNALNIFSLVGFERFVKYFKFDAEICAHFFPYLKTEFCNVLKGQSAETKCLRHNDSQSLVNLAYTLEVHGPQKTQNYVDACAEIAASQTMKYPIAVYTGSPVSEPRVTPSPTSSPGTGTAPSSGGTTVVAGSNDAQSWDELKQEILNSIGNHMNNILLVNKTEQTNRISQLTDTVELLSARVDSLSQKDISVKGKVKQTSSTQFSDSQATGSIGSFGLPSLINRRATQSENQTYTVPKNVFSTQGPLDSEKSGSVTKISVTNSESGREISAADDPRSDNLKKDEDEAIPPIRKDSGDPGDDDDDPDSGGGGGGGPSGNSSMPRFGNRAGSLVNENSKKRAYDWLRKTMPALVGKFHGTVPEETNSQPIGTAAAKWLKNFYIRYKEFEQICPASEHKMSFMQCCRILLPQCLYDEVNTSQTVQWWHSISMDNEIQSTEVKPDDWDLEIFRIEFMARWTTPNFRSDWVTYFEHTLDYDQFPEQTREAAFIAHWTNTLHFLAFIGVADLSGEMQWRVLRQAFSHTEENRRYWQALTLGSNSPIRSVKDFFVHLERKRADRYLHNQVNIVARNNRGKQVFMNPETDATVQRSKFLHMNDEIEPAVSVERLNMLLPPVAPSSSFNSSQESFEAILCHITDHAIDGSNDAIEFFYNFNGKTDIPINNDGNPLVPAAISSVCRHCNGDNNILDNGRKIGHFVRDCPKLGGTGRSYIGQMNGTAKGFKPGEVRPPWFVEQQARTQRKRMAIRAAQQKKNGSSGNTFAKNQRRAQAINPSQITTYQHLSELSDADLDDIFDSCANYDRLFAVTGLCSAAESEQ